MGFCPSSHFLHPTGLPISVHWRNYAQCNSLAVNGWSSSTFHLLPLYANLDAFVEKQMPEDIAIAATIQMDHSRKPYGFQMNLLLDLSGRGEIISLLLQRYDSIAGNDVPVVRDSRRAIQ